MATSTNELIVLRKELIFSLEHLPVWTGILFGGTPPSGGYFVEHLPVYFVQHLPVWTGIL